MQNFSGTVNLSVTGLPPDTSASLDPSAIAGSGNSALTLSVDDDAQPGKYQLTVTGTSGILTHSMNVELHIQH